MVLSEELLEACRAELKSGEQLHQSRTKHRHLMPIHSPSAVPNLDGIFYSSIFQYQTMCKSSVELGLVYKSFVNKHTCKSLLLPGKTNCIHCLRNAGFFG